jgi:hypothetical protein
MSTEDLATDEHVRGRDMWVELDHPQRGKWWNVGMPIKLSDSPARIERSPTLGRAYRRDPALVLAYDDSKIAGLKKAGRVLAAAEEGRMKIAIIGQQDFGKAVLEAFLARGDRSRACSARRRSPGARPTRCKVAAQEKGVQACSSSRRSRATRRRRR